MLFIILVIILPSSWVLGCPSQFCAIILLKLLCHPSSLRFSNCVVNHLGVILVTWRFTLCGKHRPSIIMPVMIVLFWFCLIPAIILVIILLLSSWCHPGSNCTGLPRRRIILASSCPSVVLVSPSWSSGHHPGSEVPEGEEIRKNKN